MTSAGGGLDQVPGYRIFLSHSERDRQLVAGIKSQVEAINIGVYCTRSTLSPDD